MSDGEEEPDFSGLISIEVQRFLAGEVPHEAESAHFDVQEPELLENGGPCAEDAKNEGDVHSQGLAVATIADAAQGTIPVFMDFRAQHDSKVHEAHSEHHWHVDAATFEPEGLAPPVDQTWPDEWQTWDWPAWNNQEWPEGWSTEEAQAHAEQTAQAARAARMEHVMAAQHNYQDEPIFQTMAMQMQIQQFQFEQVLVTHQGQLQAQDPAQHQLHADEHLQAHSQQHSLQPGFPNPYLQQSSLQSHLAPADDLGTKQAQEHLRQLMMQQVDGHEQLQLVKDALHQTLLPQSPQAQTPDPFHVWMSQLERNAPNATKSATGELKSLLADVMVGSLQTKEVLSLAQATQAVPAREAQKQVPRQIPLHEAVLQGPVSQEAAQVSAQQHIQEQFHEKLQAVQRLQHQQVLLQQQLMQHQAMSQRQQLVQAHQSQLLQSGQPQVVQQPGMVNPAQAQVMLELQQDPERRNMKNDDRAKRAVLQLAGQLAMPAGPYDRGVMMGAQLSNLLRLRCMVPEDVNPANLPTVVYILTGVLLEFYSARIPTSTFIVQQRLRKMGMNEKLVANILLICAKNPNAFFLYIADDVTVYIMLAHLTPEQGAVKPTNLEAAYGDEFLPLMAGVVVQRLLRSPRCPAPADGAKSLAGFEGERDFRGPPAALHLEGLVQGSSQKNAKPVGFPDNKTGLQEGDGRLLPEVTLQGRKLTAETSTVMIRNLPPEVTQKRLVEELEASGFSGQYDFCYLPSTFNTGRGKGYAFVNFRSPEWVAKFVGVWHGSKRFGLKDAVINISFAELQGREQNAKKWAEQRMKRVRNPNLRPFVNKTADKTDVSDASEKSEKGSKDGSEAGAGEAAAEAADLSDTSQP